MNNGAEMPSGIDGWQNVSVSDVTLGHKQGFYTTRDYSTSGNAKLIRITDLKSPRIDFDGAPAIGVSEDELESFRVAIGDFLIGRSGAIGTYGICYEERSAVFASYLIRFRFDQKRMLNEYFGELYQSTEVVRQLERITQGSSNQNINAENIKSLRVMLPPVAEQKEIVKVTSAWNRAIAIIELLLAKLEARTAGLTQNLLSGVMRFSDLKHSSWREVYLGDVVEYQPRTTPKPSGAFLAAGIRSHGRGVFLKPNFEAEDIALEEMFRLRTDDLVVNITFGWEGAVAIVPPDADGALVSHRFPTFIFKKNVSFPDYFRHVIRQKRFVHEMGLASPGGAGRNRVLSKKEFLRIPVELPSLEEQRLIADVLNACCREIDLLQEQLDALRDQKRGLMQKLLIGESRVKLPKGE